MVYFIKITEKYLITEKDKEKNTIFIKKEKYFINLFLHTRQERFKIKFAVN